MPAAFQDLGAFVLGDHALDLKQEIVLWSAADRSVGEDHVGASGPELLDEEHLVGVAAGEPIRGENMDLVDDTGRYGVAQTLRRGAQQRRATVALVDERVAGIQRRTGSGNPLAQRVDLAGDRVRAGLLIARHPGVKGDTDLRHAHLLRRPLPPRRGPASSPGEGGDG